MRIIITEHKLHLDDKVPVSASQILNPHFRGIDVANSSRCNISGNSIHEDAEPGHMLAAIRITGDGSENWINGNSVSAGADGDIQCNELKTRVEGNHVI